MNDICIYHNPRCSKSRQTLALLRDRGFEPDIRLYLEDPPSLSELRELLAKLGLSADQLVRRGEDAYKALGLSRDSTADDLLQAMATQPRLIERPVVVRDGRAVLGRPPENVLELLDS